MSALKVGDRISDNDPRCKGRFLSVLEADGSFVYARSEQSGVKVRIRVARVHTDGKPRRSGFSLVAKAESGRG